MLKKIIFITFLFFTIACQPLSEDDKGSTVNHLIPQCIASQSQCKISTKLAGFNLKFSQEKLSDTIKTELPFTVELSQSPGDFNNKVSKISAYIEGKDMFMGKVPIFFQKKGDSDVYLAKSLLARCGEALMIWRLWITVETATKTETFFIDFTSENV